jgi:hypothetical protein
MPHIFKAKLWRYEAATAAWHFVTLPKAVGDRLRRAVITFGFGSIRVDAEVNGVAWSTSVFPDKKSGSFLLPVKADVREKAKLSVGEPASYSLNVARDQSPAQRRRRNTKRSAEEMAP